MLQNKTNKQKHNKQKQTNKHTKQPWRQQNISVLVLKPRYIFSSDFNSFNFEKKNPNQNKPLQQQNFLCFFDKFLTNKTKH